MKTWKAVIIRLIIETITIKYDFFFFFAGVVRNYTLKVARDSQLGTQESEIWGFYSNGGNGVLGEISLQAFKMFAAL